MLVVAQRTGRITSHHVVTSPLEVAKGCECDEECAHKRRGCCIFCPGVKLDAEKGTVCHWRFYKDFVVSPTQLSPTQLANLTFKDTWFRHHSINFM